MSDRERAHQLRIALERIVSTLGPKPQMCGCCARCKACRGGLWHEAVEALEIAREATAWDAKLLKEAPSGAGGAG